VGAEVNRWFADGTRWTQTASGSMPPAENTFRTWPAVSITDVGGFVQSELRISEVLTASAGARLDRVRRDADETPSPDLATERGLSIEASLSWAGERASASVTGFRNRLDDMVSLRLVPDEKVAGRPVREYVTVGSALMRGLSASAESHLGMGFGVRAGLAYTRADDEDADAPLAAIPPLTLDGALRRSFAGAPLRWVEVEVQGADGQERISAAAGEKPTPGYVVLNARFGVEVGGARITAGVENLLNEEYRAHLDPVTLYRPARNVFLKASRGF
jgi:outer membrane receptor protein involved in Fe transport